MLYSHEYSAWIISSPRHPARFSHCATESVSKRLDTVQRAAALPRPARDLPCTSPPEPTLYAHSPLGTGYS
jgi:hypothetical protein